MRIFATVILVLSVLWSSQAWAEWTQIHQQSIQGSVLYADYMTVRRSQDLATVWILIDYDSPAISGSLSTKIQLEFNCPKAQRRMSQYMTFTEQMGYGVPKYVEPQALLDQETYQPVPPGSAAQEIMLRACLET